MDTKLFESSDLQLWRASHDCYWSVVEEISTQKVKKSSKSKTPKPTLLELDTWYQNELPELVCSRKDPHLKHEELCKLMTWKLSRGKFRPRLTELVRENSCESVERVTREGFSLLPNLRKAVECLCELRGVGPATASALLCTVAPDQTPFMADEAVLAVPHLGRLDYSMSNYLSFAKALAEKAEELNKLGAAEADSCSGWTPHDVERTLWAHHFALKLNSDLLITKCKGSSSNERKRASDISTVEDIPERKKSKHK